MKTLILILILSTLPLCAFANPTAITITGDSIGWGRSQCPSASWSQVLATAKSVNVVNVAKDATKFPAIRQRWEQLALPFPYRVAIIEGGTNNVSIGDPAASIWADFKQAVDEAHAAGFTVIGIGIGPRGHSVGMNSTLESTRTTVNASAAAYAATVLATAQTTCTGASNQTACVASLTWFHFVDLDTILGDPPVGGIVPLKAADDYGDGLHPNCTGQALIANVIGALL